LFKKAIQSICLVFIFAIFSIPMTAANFVPSDPEILLTSPAPWYIKTYSGMSVALTFDLKEPQYAHHAEVNHIYYSLDGLPAIEVNDIQKHDYQEWYSGYCTNYHADAALDNLAPGNHSITVYCQDSLGRNLSTTRTFTMSASSTNEVPSSTVTNKGIILIAIASVLVIAATASISIVYYKGKKENDSPS
jgi:hypothetical protein